MLDSDLLLNLLSFRAQTVVATLVAGFFFGEFLARILGVNRAFAAVHRTAIRLVSKLNRPHRSIATRLYRGMVAMAMLVVPALILGALLSPILPIPQLLLIAIFGRAFATWRLFSRWRRARASALPLELPEQEFLFADSHAVLRYSVLSSAEAFATGIVGAAFWYLLGGLAGLLGYLVLVEITATYRVPAFGWAAGSLFRLVNAMPHALTVLLLTLAALFVPRAHPRAVRHAHGFHGVIAALLHISLGGRLPDRELPWAGTGTPKLLPEHLARWLLLRLTATVLLLFALATPQIIQVVAMF